MHLQEETKRSEKTYQGKVFYVTRDQAELEDGKLVQRDVVHHSGGVCVVPLTDKGTVLMVQQFRYPMQQVTLEVPAGKIEPGEDPAECGRRELSEEAGRTCERYTYLGKLFPTPAYDTEVIHMYLAEKLSRPTAQNLDEGEFLDVTELPLRRRCRWSWKIRFRMPRRRLPCSKHTSCCSSGKTRKSTKKDRPKGGLPKIFSGSWKSFQNADSCMASSCASASISAR